MKYPGITTQILKNGSKNVYVRFKYKGKNYNKLNFTKLFGITSEKKAFSELESIKKDIAKGKDPFSLTLETLNDLYDERKKVSLKNGTWKPRTVESYDYFYNRYIRNKIGHKKLSKITYEDLRELYDNEMAHVENSTKNQFKRIVRPIFVEEIKKGNLHTNVVDMIETYNMPVREKLELRTFENNLDIVVKLYKVVPKYKVLAYHQIEEFRNYLMMIIMTIMHPKIKTSKSNNLISPLYDTSGNDFTPFVSKLLSA